MIASSLLGLHEGDKHRRSSPHWGRSIRYLPGKGLQLFDGLSPEKIDVGSPRVLERVHMAILRLCTENLGSESCEGTLAPEEEAALEAAAADEKTAAEAVLIGGEEELERPVVSRRRRGRREIPPPLRWMANGDGRPTGFMKAVRENGRLILKEVRIERPEVLRATREGGRLTLHLIEGDLFEEAWQEKTGESSPEEEEGEQWEWKRGEGLSRCQVVASDNREVPEWWNHRFATMA